MGIPNDEALDIMGYYGIWLLGVWFLPSHSRETYQPTSMMQWDREVFNGPTKLPITNLYILGMI